MTYTTKVTHLIHASTRSNDSFKEFKKRPVHLSIVHPEWIEEVRNLALVSPPSSRADRRLFLAPSAPARQSDKAKAIFPTRTTLRKLVNSSAWSCLLPARNPSRAPTPSRKHHPYPLSAPFASVSQQPRKRSNSSRWRRSRTQWSWRKRRTLLFLLHLMALLLILRSDRDQLGRIGSVRLNYLLRPRTSRPPTEGFTR